VSNRISEIEPGIRASISTNKDNILRFFSILNNRTYCKANHRNEASEKLTGRIEGITVCIDQASPEEIPSSRLTTRLVEPISSLLKIM
jgi:hypothetical protein